MEQTALYRDIVVSDLANKMVTHQTGLGCPPAKTVVEVWSDNCHLPANTLKHKVAKAIQTKDNQNRLEGIRNLEVQGRFLTILTDSPHNQIDYWSKAVWIPAQQFNFAVNSAQDMLSHNSNLSQWKRPVVPACRLYDDLQTLRHVLNGCQHVLRERCYNTRHNEVLQVIVNHLETYLNAAEYQLLADLDGECTFLLLLCPANGIDRYCYLE